MADLTTSRGTKASGGGLTTRQAHPVSRLRDELDTLFDLFWNRWPAPWGAWSERPPFWGLDMEEGDNEVVVRAEMPGFEANDIDVRVDDNFMTIQAEKTQESKEGKEAGYERSTRSFRRTVTLPRGVQADKAQATYRNGVLELHLPRAAEARGKRIPIQGHETSTGPAPVAPSKKHDPKQEKDKRAAAPAQG
jgi:HSP20 family protein